MELKDLSSNWKKLQKSLHNEQISKPAKRKASEANILQPQTNGQTKRPKFNKLKSQKPVSTSTVMTAPKNGEGDKMGLIYSKSNTEEPTSLAAWAEENDIPSSDLAAAYGTSLKNTSTLDIKDHSADKINAGLSEDVEAGKYIAIDCEMVGVGPAPDNESVLARVSVVNYHGQQLYDSFVLPKEAITDYRTFVSGITPQLLRSARTFEVVQADVAKLLDGKILVGHALRHDLDALLLGHPKRDIRDTSKYLGFRAVSKGRTPSLKKLAKEILGIEIQGGEHSSIEDARAAMTLFRREKDGFEKEWAKKWGLSMKNGQAAEDGELVGQRKKGKKKKKGKK
ncbi:MAG: 3'-5' exonuclease [Icmadophila ericetorum]|nr:3'-5' exonuclease [Icmadophila ericetorum]